MKKANFYEEVTELINYNFSYFEYTNNTTKSIIVCNKHKTKFSRNLKQIRKGNLCPLCSIKVKTTDKFIQESKRVWGEHKWDYSKTMYKCSRSKLTIGCRSHGTYFQIYPKQHLNQEKDCDVCKRAKLQADFIDSSKSIWGEHKWDYSNVNYTNNKTHVDIICVKHGIFSQRPDNHLYNMNGCPDCNKSKGESMISIFLDKNKILYEFQKSFNGCVNKLPLRFDFYIPKYNICIEYNGEQHYKPVKYFGGVKNLEYNRKKDKIKQEFCANNRINLLIIKYDESVNEKLKLIDKNIYNIYKNNRT
jgi:hypothetical protein